MPDRYDDAAYTPGERAYFRSRGEDITQLEPAAVPKPGGITWIRPWDGPAPSRSFWRRIWEAL